MKKLSKYLLLPAMLLASGCSSLSDGENEPSDNPDYTVPYLA